MPRFRIHFSDASPSSLWFNECSKTLISSLLKSSTFSEISRRNAGRRFLWHSAESSRHTSLIFTHSVKMSYQMSSAMSSTAMSGSGGRSFVLHGSGSEGSREEEDDEDEEEEEEDEEEEEEEEDEEEEDDVEAMAANGDEL